MRILKFPLTDNDLFMPKGSRILCAQMQNETITLWAVCDELAEKVPRRVIVLGTGHEGNGKEHFPYLGTVQDSDLVWHLFDGGENDDEV